MKVINARNVNDAFSQGVALLKSAAAEARDSRGGPVREWPEPVATVYRRPMERVLWLRSRRANPFFHFFESMWMLNGGSDLEFPVTLLPRMAEYSDDGKKMQGAYGWRWKGWFGFDQLDLIINELRQNPESRRAVLTMWEPNDLRTRAKSKDIPCNTHIYFKVRGGALHMTVCNRSNDMLWGAYGANAVHMSFLHEYIADMLCRPLGEYTQISDSFHVYVTGPGGAIWERVQQADDLGVDEYRRATYGSGPATVTCMRANQTDWKSDMATFFSMVHQKVLPESDDFYTSWWRNVVTPMWRAFYLKDKTCLDLCAAADWQRIGKQWLSQKEEPRE